MMGLTALRFYRPMTPCCFCGSMGLLLEDPRSGPGDDGDGGDCLRWAGAIGFLILLGKDLLFIFNALYLYIIMYINLRALWLLSVLRNYATI